MVFISKAISHPHKKKKNYKEKKEKKYPGKHFFFLIQKKGADDIGLTTDTGAPSGFELGGGRGHL